MYDFFEYYKVLEINVTTITVMITISDNIYYMV